MAGRSSFPHRRNAPRHVIMPRLTESERTMLRSQSGPGAGLCLSAVASSCDALRIASQLFQALLLRRLRPSSLPQVRSTCCCGRPIDPLGDHRAASDVLSNFRLRWFGPVWMFLVLTLVVFRKKKRRRGIISDTQGKHRGKPGKPGTTEGNNQRATTRGQQPVGNKQRATTRGQQPVGNNQRANLRVL